MADEHDLGSCAARRRGSSPLFPSQTRKVANQVGRSLNLDGCIIACDYCTIDILQGNGLLFILKKEVARNASVLYEMPYQEGNEGC